MLPGLPLNAWLRYDCIARSIASLPNSATVLLFASSVDGAQTLAALLSTRGIPSAAVSANTDTGARRHYIEEFRHRRIRVLANYNVLTQGFDAPAVDAVFVARPTFSPNVYNPPWPNSNSCSAILPGKSQRNSAMAAAAPKLVASTVTTTAIQTDGHAAPRIALSCHSRSCYAVEKLNGRIMRHRIMRRRAPSARAASIRLSSVACDAR